jgi:hypothetical protein
MATPKLPWPHLSAFLDAALESPPGSSIAVRTYGGQAITVKDAEIMRQAISKLRSAIRQRAGDAASPYDAIVIRAMPDLAATTITVTFPLNTSLSLPDDDQLSDLSALSAPYRAPSSACCLIIQAGDRTFSVGTEAEPAPSFYEAWAIVRPVLPGILQLTNAYTLRAGRDFQIIGGESSAPSLGSLFADDEEPSDV